MLCLFDLLVYMRNDYSTVWNNENSSHGKPEFVKQFLKLLTAPEYFQWNEWYWTNCLLFGFSWFLWIYSVVGGRLPQAPKTNLRHDFEWLSYKKFYDHFKLSWFWSLQFPSTHLNGKTECKLVLSLCPSQHGGTGMVCGHFLSFANSPFANSFLTEMNSGQWSRKALSWLTLL